MDIAWKWVVWGLVIASVVAAITGVVLLNGIVSGPGQAAVTSLRTWDSAETGDAANRSPVQYAAQLLGGLSMSGPHAFSGISLADILLVLVGVPGCVLLVVTARWLWSVFQ